MAESQRPQRVRKKRTVWEAADDSSLSNTKVRKIAASRQDKETALEPVVIEPIPTQVVDQLPEHPTCTVPEYNPPLPIQLKNGKPLCGY